MRFTKFNIFLIIVFSLIITLPTLDSFIHFSPVKDLFEKRKMAQKPEFPKNFSEVKFYPKNFEAFFNDNYGFRKTLISWHNKIMDKVFDESPLQRVVIGKDGWLYFDNENSILDAQGKAVLSNELVDKGVKSFVKNWQEARKNHIDYLLIIAADKTTIYPEFLPDYIKVGKNHRIDKFLTALLKVEPNFPILDLRPILLKAKENEIIYHKTDTHWNRRGAHYAYVEIINKINNLYNFNFISHQRKDYENKQNQYLRGDIAEMMNSDDKNINYDLVEKFEKSAFLKETTLTEKKKFHKPVYFINKNQSLPKAFIYHDSFFGNLYDFFSEHFSQSFYINEYPCNINLAVIKNYQSNIVIHQFWEGRIENILNSCDGSM